MSVVFKETGSGDYGLLREIKSKDNTITNLLAWYGSEKERDTWYAYHLNIRKKRLKIGYLRYDVSKINKI